MPTYWVKTGHSGYYVEANNSGMAKVVALDKYREQYPLRAELKNLARHSSVRLIDINPIAVSEARIISYGARWKT